MNTLTFFRIKSSITDPADIIDDSGPVTHLNVQMGATHIGDLYVKRVDRSAPEWLQYFGKSINLAGLSLSTASLGAVLVVKHGSSMYAIVFGYGRSLLGEGVLEERFGLRATLNAVEPSQLRSVDHKRLEAVSRHTREELSRAGTLDQFGLDVDRDLLRAVTGAPSDKKYGRRMSGGDSLTVVADIPLASLGVHLDMYRRVAEQTTYTAHFPWVDNVREVRDALRRSALDKHLAAELLRGSTAWSLAPPEVIDWSSTEGFRYKARQSAKVHADLDLQDFVAEHTRQDFTADGLRKNRIYHVRSDAPDSGRSWSLIRCLVGECEYRRKRYVLNEGTWYEVDEDFLEMVEDSVNRIAVSKIGFPPFSAIDKDEEAYNTRISVLRKGYFTLLDRKLVTLPQRGQVEVCDLFTTDRAFVHVKRYGGSATLSHLFNQGAVSAQLMASEPRFRAEFQKKIPTSHRWGKPDDPIRPAHFEVCYAIVGRPNKPLELPFFSKVSLRAAARLLEQLGFRVSLASIAWK
jgi:uncharacterized protein (TIGR04141 family)